MRSPSFIIFLVLAMLIAGFVGAIAYLTFSPTKDALLRGTGAPSASQQQPTPPTRPVIASSDPVRGDTSAPFAIVEFGDFLCAPCAEVETVLNSVLQQYKGRVKLVWKDMPNVRTHPLAQKAAEAARCAAVQGKFWEYHDLLFQKQEQISEGGFIQFARELNLGVGAFEECLNSGTMSDLVQRSFNEGLLLRVDATPYFFIGDRRLSGALSDQELKDATTSYAPN